MAMNGKAVQPNNSKANKIEAVGVFVEPAKTATRPIPANNA